MTERFSWPNPFLRDAVCLATGGMVADDDTFGQVASSGGSDTLDAVIVDLAEKSERLAADIFNWSRE